MTERLLLRRADGIPLSANCDVRFFTPYKYSYLLTYLLTYSVRPLNEKLRCVIDACTLGSWIHLVNADQNRENFRQFLLRYAKFL